MQLPRPGDHPLGDRVVGGDDEVVAGQVELLDGERHQAEIFAEMLPGEGQTLDETGADRPALEEAALRIGQHVADRKEIGLRPDLQHLLNHTLGAGIALQPFMDDGDLHAARSSGSKASRRSAAPRQV